MNKLLEKLKLGVVASAVIVPAVMLSHSYFAIETIKTRITDSQMVKVDGCYMVATETEPLHNHDAKYRGKWNSGKVQNEAIKLKGKEVEFEVYGWRMPLFSMYRNIRTMPREVVSTNSLERGSTYN